MSDTEEQMGEEAEDEVVGGNEEEQLGEEEEKLGEEEEKQEEEEEEEVYELKTNSLSLSFSLSYHIYMQYNYHCSTISVGLHILPCKQANTQLLISIINSTLAPNNKNATIFFLFINDIQPTHTGNLKVFDKCPKLIVFQKVPENPLTEETVGECLSLLCKTGDGLAHAFVRLDIHERYSDLYLLYCF